ncbi:MAG: hypothetical protein D6785_09645 [Planctomycetota bacterium]|nr:MAG: hypothetical protein D6785_09645 [Planctomycetota bacterium]
MWMAKIKCPKCLQIHLCVLKEGSRPQGDDIYTGHCPGYFMPFYIPGGYEIVHNFKEDRDEKVEIQWQKIDELPKEDYVEIKKWSPLRVVST